MLLIDKSRAIIDNYICISGLQFARDDSVAGGAQERSNSYPAALSVTLAVLVVPGTRISVNPGGYDVMEGTRQV